MNPITARRPDPDVPYVRVSIDPLTLLPALLPALRAYSSSVFRLTINPVGSEEYKAALRHFADEVMLVACPVLLPHAGALALAEELGVAAYIRQGHEKPVGDVRELREHVAVGL